MLGKKISITVTSKLSENFYAGIVNEKLLNYRQAYAIAAGQNTKHLSGTVIANATSESGREHRLIIADTEKAYYKPELETLLKNDESFSYKRLSCLYEKSCGAVVFFYSYDGVKILLVKNFNGKYWSFPKGHIEKDEDEMQTAVREIKEETGLDVKIYDGFREISEYSPFSRVKKKVVFFLAEAKSDRVRIQKGEIDSYIWATFHDAKKLCTYENDLRVIDRAKDFLGY